MYQFEREEDEAIMIHFHLSIRIAVMCNQCLVPHQTGLLLNLNF